MSLLGFISVKSDNEHLPGLRLLLKWRERERGGGLVLFYFHQWYEADNFAATYLAPLNFYKSAMPSDNVSRSQQFDLYLQYIIIGPIMKSLQTGLF